MPRRAPRQCNRVMCGRLTESRFCALHQSQHEASVRLYDHRRGSASRRGYDRDWQSLREAFLQAHPLCQCDDCQEGLIQVTAANVVDHKISIRSRPDLRLDWGNLRSMNKHCHDRRTAREQGFGRSK